MAANRYPEGMVEWIRQQYLKMDVQQLTKECNSRYGTNLGTKAMGSLKKRYGFSGGPRAKIYSEAFPEEISAFITKNYKGTGRKEMCEMLLREFGKEYTANQIKSFYTNHNLNSGITGHFEKGHQSHNKGKKMGPEQYEKAKATMFQKGNRPHNAAAIGDTTITEDGYEKTKVAEPNKWKFTQRIIWQKNFGEIPKGMLVAFKDGDKRNMKPDNLMLITNEEHLELIRRGMRSQFAEITEVGLTLAKVNIAVRRRKKK